MPSKRAEHGLRLGLQRKAWNKEHQILFCQAPPKPKAASPPQPTQSPLGGASYFFKPIGTIFLPFYTKPDDPGHKNPVLTSIFNAAIPQLVGILADWNNLHPVIASFNEYFSGQKKHLHSREASHWMDTLGLALTPELEAVLTDPLIRLIDHPALLRLTEEECQRRVMGVGSVLLQILAVQHELGEPLNLNGDLIEDLKDESVVACLADGDEALNAIFSIISTSTRLDAFVQQMLAFKRDHTMFNEELRPPLFRRDRPSYFPPTKPIPVQIKSTLNRKGDLVVDEEKPPKRTKSCSKTERKKEGPKCQRDDEIEQERSQKRPKVSRKKEGKIGDKKSTQKPAVTTRSRRTIIEITGNVTWVPVCLRFTHSRAANEDGGKSYEAQPPSAVADGEFTFWHAKVACPRAKWLVSGGGVDLGGITRPRPAEWLASHFVGLASHSAGLASAEIEKWLAHCAHCAGLLCHISHATRLAKPDQYFGPQST
ncbi:hypothetical protein DFH08DRAFT_824012 [Mycena albidolilacea]|uniref:Uncharacterized protein n=1 Tax=Mycena albidolilacea TaxID=1033008 RepID=A0AAD6Z4Z2_9AGAR|nr:hypothetical protein DFH08DRAFT_824012 [Mycena albidolilacea]